MQDVETKAEKNLTSNSGRFVFRIDYRIDIELWRLNLWETCAAEETMRTKKRPLRVADYCVGISENFECVALALYGVDTCKYSLCK